MIQILRIVSAFPLALVCTVCPTRLAAQAQAGDLETLLTGVAEIATPGTPGSLCVFGDQSFPLVAGSVAGAHEPAVAVSRLGSGRMAAFGHDGYLTADALKVADTQRLMSNLLNWLAAGRTGPRVGVVGINGLAAALREAGFNAIDATLASVSSHDVVIPSLAVARTRAEIDGLLTYVRGGGAVVGAMTGWGWAQINSTRSLREDFSGNWLFGPAGIVWASSYLSRTSAQGFQVSRSPAEFLHAARALDAVTAGRTLTTTERIQVATVLTVAMHDLPAADPVLRPRLTAALQTPGIVKNPTPRTPVNSENVLGRLAVAQEFEEIGRLLPAAVAPHPSAATFPGPVPASAPRETRSVLIRTSRPRWHSTGLYAPPGELITVRIPTAVAGKGLAVRIGAHTDRLWGLSSWTRFPEVSFNQTLAASETRVANAFGGLIYLEVPAGTNVADFAAEISGGVAAPRFVKGETTLQAWRDTLRSAPAPWGEIEGTSMIVTTQSASLLALDDPLAVAAVWDRVMDATADLATIPRVRSSPERFVCDQQISAGYMHSGYPLMCGLDVTKLLVDASFIGGPLNPARDQNWGFFHEIGHNHQNADWTFAGTTEVTVNLFTLYSFEQVCGMPVAQNPRGSLAFRQEQMKRYNFAKPSFELWQSDAFLALVMYEQLQQGFGWEAYRSVFAEYLALSAEARPRTDEQKRDQWLTRFSRTVQRNLGPFFQTWGIPTTAAARASLEDLPWWMPAELSVLAPAGLPRIANGSERITVAAGVDAVLTLNAGATAGAAVQWIKDGRAIAGATSSTLTLRAAGAATAGTYWATVSASSAPTLSNAVVVAVDSLPPSRLVNLSVLTTLAPGETATLGTVLGGTGPSGTRPVLARAAGPALAAFGVTGVAPDPVLRLNRTGGASAVELAGNGDWGGDATLTAVMARTGAFAWSDPASRDAALHASALAPGNYTMQAWEAGGRGGAVLMELYDAGSDPGGGGGVPRLINLSVLKQISSGEALTAGFVISGGQSRRVLVRAVGPTLGAAPFGMSDTLSDPRIDLRKGQVLEASNDDWAVPKGGAAGAPVLAETAAQVGAFPLLAGSKDAVLLVTLTPGNYTAEVRGAPGTAGMVLVEVYEAP